MKNLSAVILTKNEEKNIKGCIDSLEFCDEVVVIDDNSTDNTTKIAKKLGATVFKKDLNGNFAEQRNYGLEKAKSKWVLFIDPDERVSKGLENEIKTELNSVDGINGFYVKRIDFLLGKELKHGEVGDSKFLRLARKGSGHWQREVHEYWEIFGKSKVLRNPLLHYPHPTLSEFVSSVNQYSKLHAKANKKEGKTSNLIEIVFFPFLKFANNYFVKLGFLDGVHGFVHAILMSFHSFISWSELWLNQKNISD